jgi:hypothetical protein
LEVRVETVPVGMAHSCDEIFMCTTAGGIMPITLLDDQPVHDGKLGPITKKIWDGYWAMHYDGKYSFEIQYAQAGQRIINGATEKVHQTIGDHVTQVNGSRSGSEVVLRQVSMFLHRIVPESCIAS